MPPNSFTAFPNVLIDAVMPHLSDTEFRVLAVIVRQTHGWGRHSHWLSHSLLKRSTGRESAAISRAVDHLVKRGLIIVRDQDDRRLHQAAERRRSRSKLVYSVHHLFLQSASYRAQVGFGTHQIGTSKGENNTTKTKKRKKQERE